MRELSRRQRQVLEFITEHIQDQGYPPTFQEIAEHLGIRSKNGVSEHIRALERKGFLARREGKSRGLRLLAAAGRTVTVPIVERPGADLPAPEGADRMVLLDRLLVGPENDLFVLRTDESMILEEDLSPGDFLVVSRKVLPKTGDLMVLVKKGRIVIERSTSKNSEAGLARYIGYVQAMFRRL